MNKRPDIAYIRQYVNGELPPREMFEIEKAAHEDELLRDIILGLEAEKAQKANPAIWKDIQQHISKRSSSEDPKDRKKLIPFWRIGIAASLLVTMGIAFYVWRNQEDSTTEVKPTEQHVADTDNRIDPPVQTDSNKALNRETILSEKEGGAIKTSQKPSRIAYQEPTQNHSSEQEQLVGLTDDSALFKTADSNIDEVLIVGYGAKKKVSVVGSVSLVEQNRKNGESENLMIRGAAKANTDQVVNIDPLDIKSIVQGIVIDKGSKQPLSQVMVTDLASKQSVFTDSTGRFILASTVEKPVIQINYLGFDSQTLTANHNNRIELESSNQWLEEVVVVTGSTHRRQQKHKKTNSEPLIGKKAYKSYVDEEAKNANMGKGTVILVFDIDEDGKPIHIRIKKSGSPTKDQKAIDIIQHGPLWKKGSDNKSTAWKVTFK